MPPRAALRFDPLSESLYQAIIEGRAEQAREVSSRHILYVQEVLEEVRQEVQRMARAERRKGI